jgi:hypothetical protein
MSITGDVLCVLTLVSKASPLDLFSIQCQQTSRQETHMSDAEPQCPHGIIAIPLCEAEDEFFQSILHQSYETSAGTLFPARLVSAERRDGDFR